MTTLSRSGQAPFFDLSARVKLRLTGTDAFRFLNGQITNNLAKASAPEAIQASVLSPKGKLAAHIYVSKESDDSFLLDADPALGQELPDRLGRYIIADDVQLEVVTEKFSLFHALTERAPTLSATARIVTANRFGASGFDVWAAADPEQTRAELADRFSFCGDECTEVFRIERGIPRWARELTPEIIPVEANLEESSIDYAKGCYIGQEVISRMKMSGQRNKSLCGLISLSGAPLEPQTRLTTPAQDVGWITSAARSAQLGKEIGLGYVKRGYNSAGTQLQAAGVPVEVVALPFL